MMSSKQLKFFGFAALLAALLGVTGVGCFGASDKPLKSSNGLPFAPQFSLKDAKGKNWSLDDFKDSSVFVHFWAAWCAPCVPEIKEIMELAKKTSKDSAGKTVYWVFISEDPNFEKARKVLDDSALPSHIISLLDVNEKTSGKFGTYQFPETYILDREHAVLDKRIGAQEWGGEAGTLILKRALGI